MIETMIQAYLFLLGLFYIYLFVFVHQGCLILASTYKGHPQNHKNQPSYVLTYLYYNQLGPLSMLKINGRNWESLT